MIEVKSSAIRGVHMGPEGLEVTFTSGKCYRYAGVTQDQLDAMLSADSIGKYFATEIKPNHEATPIDDGPTTTEDDSP